MDYEEGQVNENLLNDLHAKKVLSEETVDHLTSSQRNASPVSISDLSRLDSLATRPPFTVRD